MFKKIKNYIVKKWKYVLAVLGLTVGIAYAAGIDLPKKEILNAELLQTKYNQSEIKAKYQLDGVSLVRNKIINPELDKYKGEPKDEIKVRIGNKGLLGGEEEFNPSIEIKRWNEVSFKITPDLLDVPSKDKNLRFENEKIIFETPKMNFEIYEYTKGEGGYKYIWYLNEKPESNKVCFNFKSEG